MTQYHDTPYLNLLNETLATGHSSDDRTGTGTTKVFGRMLRFDLSDGTIPLLTTKKMHLPAIIHEILWYLQGNTSSTELERNKIRIWREWSNSDGELGPIYGHKWRSWESLPIVQLVPQRSVKFVPQNKHIRRFDAECPQQSTDPYVGRIIQTQECGSVIILGRDETDIKYRDHKYTVQFVDTGYKKSFVRKSVINRGHIIDMYLPRVNGVGYLGDYDKTDPNLKQLQVHWYKMLDRCYNNSTSEYVLYGGQGIFVHPDWHNFAVFQREVKQIPNWNNKRTNPSLYELDKDYFSSNCYSKHTCVWLLSCHNTLYRKNPKPIKMTTPDGYIKTSLSVSELCSGYGLKCPLVYKVLHRKQTHHHHFKFEYMEVPDDHAARYALPIDQIANLIERLRTKPDDRRLLVTAWDPSVVPDDGKTFSENVANGKQALPPCHYVFQFVTRLLTLEERVGMFEKEFGLDHHLYRDTADQIATILDTHNIPTRQLSCILSQRSADLLLGVPFNIAQYSILTRMVAEVVGMSVGEFVWVGADCHIYHNHFDQVREQLSRELYPSPTLRFARSVANIDDFKYDDFIIENYQFHPTIKAKVSV